MKACHVCHRLLLLRNSPTLIALLDKGPKFVYTLCHRAAIDGYRTDRQAARKTVDLLVAVNSGATQVWLSVM